MRSIRLRPVNQPTLLEWRSFSQSRNLMKNSTRNTHPRGPGATVGLAIAIIASTPVHEQTHWQAADLTARTGGRNAEGYKIDIAPHPARAHWTCDAGADQTEGEAL